MDIDFGNRAAEVRTTWGPHKAKTKVPALARVLHPGLDLSSEEGKRRVKALHNLETGHRPHGGLPTLQALYAPFGEAAKRIAIYVDEGRGVLPRPVNLDDASDPRPVDVAGFDAVPVLERIVNVLVGGKSDPKSAITKAQTIAETALDMLKSAQGRFSGIPSASRNYREWLVEGVSRAAA